MPFDPAKLAVEYYFGDLQYWKLPRIAADALQLGYDGPALRRLAGLANRIGSEIRADDIRANEIDSAFREMGVNAPITKEEARMVLAIESANRALNGGSNVFDEEAKNAPRPQWGRIETDLKNAFTDFLSRQKARGPEWPAIHPHEGRLCGRECYSDFSTVIRIYSEARYIALTIPLSKGHEAEAIKYAPILFRDCARPARHCRNRFD
jgi:hypothetical protein